MNRYIGVRVRFLPVALFVLLAFSLLTGISGFAAPGAAGDLDTGFGNGGKVEYRAKDVAPVSVVGFAMQGDGKAILASNSNDSIVLARYNPDGSLDPGFGGDGMASITIAEAGGFAQRIALQADGKIVIAIRQTGESGNTFSVLRLHSNGGIDATFGDQGKQIVSFAASNAVSGLVAVSGNKIIVAGQIGGSLGGEIGVVQLLDDGALDSSFSGDGKLLLDFGPDTLVTPTAMKIDTAGRLIINGVVAIGARDSYNIVTRLTPAGDMDTSFGVGGKAEVRFVEGGSLFTSIALDELGRIVLAGSVYVEKSPVNARDFAVARLLDNGALDTSFGAAGRVHTDYFGDEDLAYSVIVLPGGGLAVGGVFSEGGGDPAFGLAVYTNNGALDSNFASGGKSKLRFPGIRSASSFGLALTPDGKILQAGSADNSNPPPQLALARFFTNGALDNSFSDDGMVVTPVVLPGQVDPVAALLQPGGKIVVAGTTYYNHTVLVRFNADGSLDRSFGENGAVRTNFASGIEIARALTTDSAGRLIVAANGNSPGNPRIIVLRFSADGVLDRSFGQGGKATLDNQPSSSAEAVAVDQAGRILVAGGIGYSVGVNFGLVRFNADGTVDNTFGVDGTVELYFGISDFGDRSQQVNSLAIGADGKILLAGGFAESFALARFNDDGRLDITFGDEGKLLIRYGGPITRTSAMELLPDGRILLAGTTGSNSGNGGSSVLLRLDANGVRDPSFGNNGAVIDNVPYLVNALAVQADGKIVLGGATLARYNSDGSPDVGFGSSGVAAIPFSNPAVAAVSVLIAPEGRIVIAGAAILNIYVPDHQFHLAAYRADNAAPTSTPTSLPVSPMPTSGPGCRFSDVCGSDYFAVSVDYLLERGVVSGYADNTFRPFADTTRSQLAKIVVIAASLPTIIPATPTFNDVDEESPFYSYVETAAAWGIIAGYGDGTFRPGFAVTRGQLSKIIVLAEGWALITPLASSFSDVASDNPFYSYIETALAHGIISGYGDGTFRWNLGATRGQIAKIVYLAEIGVARK